MHVEHQVARAHNQLRRGDRRATARATLRPIKSVEEKCLLKIRSDAEFILRATWAQRFDPYNLLKLKCFEIVM